MPALAVVVLAAGLGKRFKSGTPKVLHEAAGAPLIHYVLRAVEGMRQRGRIIVVVGHGRDRVEQAVDAKADFVEQTEQLGTADAVARCRNVLIGFDGDVLVLPGDAPLLRAESLDRLVESHRTAKADATLLSVYLETPEGYGRIVRGEGGRFARIVEEADAGDDERKIREVSTGVWCFRAKPLFDALERVRPDNAQGEYYLPDAASIIASEGGMMYTQAASDPKEVMGVNDRQQLSEAAREIRLKKIEKLAATGVTFEDPASAWIDETVEIGPDTVVLPSVRLTGSTKIGSGCRVGPQVDLADTAVGDGAEVLFTVARASEIGPRCQVGPFAYLRPGAKLEEGAKIGTFVEVVRSTIGEGSRVPHLSYVGDTEMGKDVNLGAGTITGNYDGETEVKSKTVIGDGVDTGSGTTIVAPVMLGEDAVTGAGAVVTKDVAPGDVVIGIPAKPIRKRKASTSSKPRDNGAHDS